MQFLFDSSAYQRDATEMLRRRQGSLSVILGSPTRQSLRRSGYGSPAKAESRYGDGASEATKNLPSNRPEQFLRFLLR